MANTLRKRLGPLSVVSTIAVVGLLAAFIALAAMPDAASAQTPPPPPLPATTPEPTTDPNAPPPPPPPTVEVTGGAPDSYVIEGPGFVDQHADEVSDYTLVVTDADGNNPDYDTHGGNMVRVRFTRHDAVASIDEAGDIVVGCLPDNARLDDTGLQGQLTASLQSGVAGQQCSITMDLADGNDGFTIRATTVPNNTRLGVSVTVIGGALQDTHTVTFLRPQAPPPTAIPTVEPQMGMSDAATVVSYGDWEHHYNVTDGYIVRDTKGQVHMVNQMHNETGWLHRDEPVNNRIYALGMSDRETLTVRSSEQPGQRTVEVLLGATDVQLTVTTAKEGPVYVRLLDSDGEVIGLDVDEASAERGMDVVGLDSHGRLELPSQVALTTAKALAYDQYSWHTPSDTTAMTYLEGKAGQYYQGTFRVMDPCPGSVVADPSFTVQVWNQSGTYLQTTEEIHCINPDPLRPSELTVTTFSDRVGVATLRWNPALGSVAHHVLVADAITLQIVPGTIQELPSGTNEVTFTDLSANVPYIFAVAGERGPGDYSAPSFIIQEMNWAPAQ